MSDGPFGPPSSPFIAGVEAVFVAAFLFCFGYLLVAGLDRRRRLDPADRAALALPALGGFALLLMLLHLVTGGFVFERWYVVLALMAAAAVRCVYWIGPRTEADRAPTSLRRSLIVLGGLAAVIWGLPVFQLLPLHPSGDMGLHAGWTNQLLNGELLPSAAVPGDIPNFYPWLFHALQAWITHLVPGSHPYLTYGPIQILQPVGMALALFALGRRLFGSQIGGWATALLGAFTGGVGFVIARGPELLLHAYKPGAADNYLGDLLFVRGPNVAFSNLSPPFPRDLALTFLISAALLAVIAARERRFSFFWAGAVVGLIGLTGAESFFVGFPLIALFAYFSAPEKADRIRDVRRVAIPALALYGLWVGPMVFNYLRLDGFVNTSQNPPTELGPLGFIGAWGVIFPLALAGGYALVKGRPAALTRTFLYVALGVTTALLTIAGLIPLLLGEGFTALGRPHRYWPLLALAVALVAAYGATWILPRLSERAATIAPAVTVVLALTSPILATLAERDTIPKVEVLQEALQGDGATVYEALRDAGRRCIVAASTETPLAFAYTGHRFVSYVWRLDSENDARIRWKASLESLPSDEERAASNLVIAKGRGNQEQWQELVDRYNVDVIVADKKAAESERFEGLKGIPIKGMLGGEQVLFQLDSCG